MRDLLHSVGAIVALTVLSWQPTGARTAEFSPDGWRLALPLAQDPGWAWRFPDVYMPMQEFKTGWWYYTGHLEGEDGARFGYQLTFFRIGTVPKHQDLAKSAQNLRDGAQPRQPPVEIESGPSAWRFDSLWMAHIAVTDERHKRYYHSHRLVRGAAGLAGHRGPSENLQMWVGDWTIGIRSPSAPTAEQTLPAPDAVHSLSAQRDGFGFHLNMDAGITVLQGDQGVSQKAEGLGRASYYFSHPSMATRGTLTLPDREQPVTVSGQTWCDREIGSNQLGNDQSGWDWFAIQLDNGDCLMLYQMRLKQGGTDPHSHGKWIPALTAPEVLSARGMHPSARTLGAGDFRLDPGATWRSAASTAEYPLAWQINVPTLDLSLTLKATVQNQEFLFEDPPTIAYWEGSHTVRGTLGGKPVSGRAYVEMTGYSGAVPGL